MKITKRQLQRIIKEEKARLVQEMRPGVGEDELVDGVHDGALLNLDDYDDLRESLQEFANEYAHNTGYEPQDVMYAIQSIVQEL